MKALEFPAENSVLKGGNTMDYQNKIAELAKSVKITADQEPLTLGHETAVYQLMGKPIDQIHAHISDHNTKIGKIINFSTLPGDGAHAPVRSKKDDKPTLNLVFFCNIAGTCPGVCNDCSHFCYAFDSITQHPENCVLAWGENTRLFREDPVRLFAELEQYFDKKRKPIKEFRINVAGELERYEWLEMWCAFAEGHPETRFGIYTKRFGFVLRYLKAHGEFPKNFFLNGSEWNHNIDAFKDKLLGKTNIFAYSDSLKEAAEYVRHGYRICQAINYLGMHTGIQCDACGYCYGKYGIMNSCVLDHSGKGRQNLRKEIKELYASGELENILKVIWGDEEGETLYQQLAATKWIAKKAKKK